ncbi:hypothetical protein MKEN_00161100 [Mycena kentingensis (nom. inval.)]|nr:hypothetical protein MKEN_00161100 [Mycena kentingensis (nom. inval.)]
MSAEASDAEAEPRAVPSASDTPPTTQETPPEPEIDSEDEYYDNSEEMLWEALNPSRPPSPTPSIHDEEDEPLEPAEEQEDVPESPFVARTRNLRAVLDDLPEDEMESKLLHVLDAMDETGLDIPLFMEVLCWGRKCAVQNARIRYARTTFMCSDELPLVVKRCLKPPRWNASTRKKRAKGGRARLAQVVSESCIETMREEMRTLEPLLTTETATDVQAGPASATAKCTSL